MILPRHEIIFENDSVFKYSKWYLDTDTNPFEYYSEGIYSKIDKNTYLLKSERFNPDSLELVSSVTEDPTIDGLHLIVSTEMFSTDFENLDCRYIVDLDDQRYIFFSSLVDTIILSQKPKYVNITLHFPPDSIISNPRYFNFKALPIQIPDSNSNSITIVFPDVLKYTEWLSIDNILLKRIDKKTYLFGNDKWPVALIKK